LKAHLDFDRIREWGQLAKRPILVLGAANVLTARLKKFVSRTDVIQVKHILASCAVPNIFPAVEIGDDAYWDGLFSDNPPHHFIGSPSLCRTGKHPGGGVADQDRAYVAT
jgi:NTE family protein